MLTKLKGLWSHRVWPWICIVWLFSLMKIGSMASWSKRTATHLWERLVRAKLRRRARRKYQAQRLAIAVTKGLEKDILDGKLKRHEVDQIYAQLAESGHHFMGYDWDPSLDDHVNGRPFWKRQHANIKHTKNKTLGRLMQASRVLGVSHEGLTVPEIRAKLKAQTRRRPKTPKYAVVKKSEVNV